MRAVLVYADGAPCPTLVLPARAFPSQEGELAIALRGVRRWLVTHDAADVLKIALIAPAADPRSALDYRFVQCVPGPKPHFEFRGSCGHSILAAVLAGAYLGFSQPPRPGRRYSVNVLNNGDEVVCEAQQGTDRGAVFAVQFQHGSPALHDLLLFGEPITRFAGSNGETVLSGVSLGNPYVFVDGATIGWSTPSDLLGAGSDLFLALSGVRREAEQRLGWPPGTFPKVAGVVRAGEHRLAVRAISVPSWHPTLALTGLACLAAAAAIPSTVPARLAGRPTELLTVDTTGGSTVATAVTTGPPADRLRWAGVHGKAARLIDVVELPAMGGEAALARPGRGWTGDSV